MKTQHTIHLDCLDPNADQRRVFIDRYIPARITVQEKPRHECVVMFTEKGAYVLLFDKMLNLFEGRANGIDIQITLGRSTAKLVYWT